MEQGDLKKLVFIFIFKNHLQVYIVTDHAVIAKYKEIYDFTFITSTHVKGCCKLAEILGKTY